jgi:phosphoglycolate phosphatase
MTPFKSVVAVDLDGTLIDTAPDITIAINRMRARFGLLEVSEQLITTLVGKGSEHLVRSVLALDCPPSQVEQLFSQALDHYMLAYSAVNGSLSQVYPGVREGLSRMKGAGLQLACVTNKPQAFAVQLLESKELLPEFKLVLGGDSVAKKKPDPEPFAAACRYFGILPAALVAVGDSANDAQAARAIGCHSVIVSYGYNHGSDVRNLDADAIVDSLLEAAIWIENLQTPTAPAHESR